MSTPRSAAIAGTRVKAWIAHPRLLLAAKTAIAVGLAWFLAHLVPGVADDYPYYAPLGALISVSPTLMTSVKRGAQTLAALAIGILLAGAIIIFWEPNVFSISLVVGVGVLIAGSRWLTAGGEYVAVAALFVLIIGGQDADDYSVGYLVQMAVGIAVGLGVNLLILPPLNTTSAVLRLAGFRSLLSDHLHDIGKALIETWPPVHEDWAGRSGTLTETADRVREAVTQADESRKLNPRARLHQRNLEKDYEDLADLETMTFHVRDLTQVLAAAIWESPFPAELPQDLREPLSDTIHAVADVLTLRNADEDLSEGVDAADDALRTLLERLDQQRDVDPSALSPTASVAMDLRRILAIMQGSSTTANA
ncbi:aromatic acid exporter family protein [Mycetocola sp. 2940]|uniref:FUSC family protein n=1 Tax=Mycetocola sp. 2940 TaxID=3156452 RepID=UPI0033945C9D